MGETNHRLESAWSIWEHRDDNGKSSYGDSMHKLCTVDTVEDFWGYFNNLPKPSHFFFDGYSKKKFVDRSLNALSIFKDGIKPEWEDPQNSTGGDWYINKKIQLSLLDMYWERMILGLIGETIDPDNYITGARVVDKTRKDSAVYRIELWMRVQDTSIIEQVKMNFLKCLAGNDEKMKGINAANCVFRSHI